MGPSGPHRLAGVEAEGGLTRPDCAQALRRARDRQGQALGARLRASLTAPARDASSVAQGRDEETAA